MAVGLVRNVIQTRLKKLEILIRFSLDIRLRFIWYLGQIASGSKVLKNSLVIKWKGWINLGSLFSTPGLAQWFWCWGGENWEILWGLWERRGIGEVAGETLSITTGLSMPLSCCCFSILMVIRDVVGWSFWGTPKTFPKIMCNSVRCVLYASLEVTGFTIITGRLVGYVSPPALATFPILTNHRGLSSTRDLKIGIFPTKDSSQLGSPPLLDLDSVTCDDSQSLFLCSKLFTEPWWWCSVNKFDWFYL